MVLLRPAEDVRLSHFISLVSQLYFYHTVLYMIYCIRSIVLHMDAERADSPAVLMRSSFSRSLNLLIGVLTLIKYAQQHMVISRLCFNWVNWVEPHGLKAIMLYNIQSFHMCLCVVVCLCVCVCAL